jgi:hypothetical protein
MNIPSLRLIFCCLVVALISSCGMLGAGSHVYCETITLACPSDSIIQRLIKLKATGRFEDARSFPDGLGGEQWVLHDFFFYDPEHQFLVRMEVPLHTPTTTKLHIAGIKDFTAGTEWLGFADVQAEKKKILWTWFDRVVRPALVCNPL